MSKRCYYEVLCIEKTASAAQIKAAYRKLALQHHPDRNQDDATAEERFKEASEAYEVLSDQQKRQIYDTYGHQGLSGQGFQGFSGMNVEDIFSSFGDIFEDFFGMGGGRGRGRSSAGQAGNNLRYDMEISLKEAYYGLEREIEVSTLKACADCEGLGREAGSSLKTCAHCGGSGAVTQRQGFFVVQVACPICRGQGQMIEKPCKTCHGQGRTQQKKKLQVKIPAGVDTGMRLVLRGEGEAGIAGGAAGDLYVFVQVKADKHYERNATDLISQVDITFSQAALGDKIEVNTFDESHTINIPAGTQSHDEYRMKKMGFPDVHHHKRGDHLVYFRVKTPTKLSKKQRELFEVLAKEEKK
ncbi:MAG: molecular chaperone DnaJ [Deltaproteobacteria bacterium CG11_big_fil_rev_8_21_14_0_20_42_23]|nr:MAG: molecular chaperone DnaJ [Deltaproteobacteria bacterium CG11_big_fil_rev_8_21_14_0_20_42_23]PJC63762.1 MAG: molecular chaperone DnaJ [Deltaproteobacteria bacterium CG_4_9_14_0_2_um_filter_42_21]